MALHTELPIYRTGAQLLGLAISVQEQMPRSMKRYLGEKNWEFFAHSTTPETTDAAIDAARKEQP